MSDWIAHRSYKYIKRARGKNGKWRYWYKNSNGKKSRTFTENTLHENIIRENTIREATVKPVEVKPIRVLDLRVPHGGSPSVTIKSNGVVERRYPDGLVEKDKKSALAKAQSSYKKTYDFVQKYSKLPVVGGVVSLIGNAVSKYKRKKINDIILD